MRTLAHATRTPGADLRLGLLLAFVAGGVNAGGFLAIGAYTSHMTGLLSTVADAAALDNLRLAGLALLGLAAFVVGATAATLLVAHSQRHAPHRQWALPLLLEGLLIGLFGLYGTLAPAAVQVPALGMLLLCTIMGLQNATISIITQARIRSTHVTGMFTDIGIELGRTLNPQPTGPKADTSRLYHLLGLVSSFLWGGLAGAVGFTTFGLGFAFPYAAVLLALALPHLRRS